MKNWIRRGLFILLAAALLCGRAFAMPETLVPVGRTVGIHLRIPPVVTGFAPSGSAREAGLRVGDCIVSVDGQRIASAAELRSRIGQEPVCLGVDREGEHLEISMTPERAEDTARLGLRVRDGITGVGTVTFYDPATGCFGALGHSVNDPNTGSPAPVAGGSVMAAQVTEAVRGTPGHPGELRAQFSMDAPVGEIECSDSAGIFGSMRPPRAGQALPLAPAAQVKAAPAQILANVEGEEVRAFAVEILKIDPNNGEGRNFLLHVCDEALIERTGGIVQGMSGSPIVQDGRFIGAVTHVLVDDPTLGYGISIETMLCRAGPASRDAGPA